MTDHLGYERHAVAGRNTANSRNGSCQKSATTEVGEVRLDVRVGRPPASLPVKARTSHTPGRFSRSVAMLDEHSRNSCQIFGTVPRDG
jgi:Transposase, Mutator family